jgi:hypothetical protein
VLLPCQRLKLARGANKDVSGGTSFFADLAKENSPFSQVRLVSSNAVAIPYNQLFDAIVSRLARALDHLLKSADCRVEHIERAAQRVGPCRTPACGSGAASAPRVSPTPIGLHLLI